MADLITLTCPTCGGKLEITKDEERFACGFCGNEHIVKRGEGIIWLAAVTEKLEQAGAGAERTASEFAIPRLNEEIPLLKKKLPVLRIELDFLQERIDFQPAYEGFVKIESQKEKVGAPFRKAMKILAIPSVIGFCLFLLFPFSSGFRENLMYLGLGMTFIPIVIILGLFYWSETLQSRIRFPEGIYENYRKMEAAFKNYDVSMHAFDEIVARRQLLQQTVDALEQEIQAKEEELSNHYRVVGECDQELPEKGTA